ncbi:hypothetical protein ACFQ14_04470 [Pseudahrensia aquimaris]|uniref:Hda lid domain-containing protein n=1 Tax=Pseudahrensia aquimaris TaxID=744461 RepID=A0ABW3FDM0_9HYPH
MASRTRPEQLPLHLPLQAAQAREDLIVGPSNTHAVEFLDSWPQWPTRIAILAGPTGSGKSHLAQIWASRSEARFLDPSLDSPDDPSIGSVVVEDIAQGNFAESWLFHLINTLRANGGDLLLTSRRWPSDWGIVLPDLQSRMKTAHLMEISEPDDMLLAGVLTKLFADRQVEVDPSVIEYLVTRMERSLASAQEMVERLDVLSLAEKRAVTRPLVAEALRQMGLQGSAFAISEE